MDDERVSPRKDLADFGKAVARGVASEVKTWLAWGGGGAVVGALGVGGFGGWFFGFEGLTIGAAIGAVVGAVAGLLLYLFIQSEL